MKSFSPLQHHHHHFVVLTFVIVLLVGHGILPAHANVSSILSPRAKAETTTTTIRRNAIQKTSTTVVVTTKPHRRDDEQVVTNMSMDVASSDATAGSITAQSEITASTRTRSRTHQPPLRRKTATTTRRGHSGNHPFHRGGGGGGKHSDDNCICHCHNRECTCDCQDCDTTAGQHDDAHVTMEDDMDNLGRPESAADDIPNNTDDDGTLSPVSVSIPPPLPPTSSGNNNDDTNMNVPTGDDTVTSGGNNNDDNNVNAPTEDDSITGLGNGSSSSPTTSPMVSSLSPPPTSASPTATILITPTMLQSLDDLYRTVSCVDDFRTDEAMTVQVPYQYNVTIDTNVLTMKETRDIFEQAVLDAVVKEFVVCADNSRRRGRRQLSSGNAVSALPQDKSCGDTCVQGGMTLYMEEGSSISNTTACEALDIVKKTIDGIIAEHPGISSISLSKNPECKQQEAGDNDNDNTDDSPPPVAGAAVSSMSAEEPTFPVAAAATAGVVAAALLMLLALVFVRRRKANDRDSVHIWSPDDPGAIEAYGAGYKDGYSYRMVGFKNGWNMKDDDDLPSQIELEGNAVSLGFSVKDSLDAYCNGFRDGYDSACSDLVQPTTDVHKCNSSSCQLCRRREKEPVFVPLEKDSSYLTCCETNTLQCC